MTDLFMKSNIQMISLVEALQIGNFVNTTKPSFKRKTVGK